MTKTATLTSVPKTTELRDAYDGLSQPDMDIHDHISRDLGWTPAFTEQGWVATKGDQQIGPVSALTQLRKAATAANNAPDDPGDFKGRNTEQHPTRDDAPRKGKSTKVDPGTILEEGEIKLDADRKGNTYLPGAEEIVDVQLKDAAFTEFHDKEAWKEAGKKKKESKTALDAVAAAKKHLFYPDPENTGDLIYKVGGITVRMDKEITVKVKTEKTQDEDDD